MASLLYTARHLFCNMCISLTHSDNRPPAPLPVIFRPCDLACNGGLQVHALRVAHAAGRERTHRRGQGLLGLRPVISNDDAAIGHDLQRGGRDAPEMRFRFLPFTGLDFDGLAVGKVAGGERATRARD